MHFETLSHSVMEVFKQHVWRLLHYIVIQDNIKKLRIVKTEVTNTPNITLKQLRRLLLLFKKWSSKVLLI